MKEYALGISRNTFSRASFNSYFKIGLLAEVVSKNPKSVEDYKAGKDRALGFLVGQIMKETKGKANPKLVNKLLIEILNS